MADGRELRLGSDVAEVARVQALLDRSGERFARRWFTAGELEYCLSRAVPARHLAARWAAKEAVAKALSWHWHGPLAWRDLEIVRSPSGAPVVALHGPWRAAAVRTGLTCLEVSMSHGVAVAVATALARFAPAPATGIGSRG